MSAAQVEAIRNYREPEPSGPVVDAEAVRAALRKLLDVRARRAKLEAALASVRAADNQCCVEIARLARSLSGFIVDGQSVVLHPCPGKVPLVYVRPITVLA